VLNPTASWVTRLGIAGWSGKDSTKRNFGNSKGEVSPAEIAVDPIVIRQLDSTRRFLFEKFEGEPTDEKLGKAIEDGRMDIWVTGGRVSKYYLVLSPRVARICGLKELGEKLQFDVVLAQEQLTPGVRLFFNKEFADEIVKSDETS
jgi:hypothetical protein